MIARRSAVACGTGSRIVVAERNGVQMPAGLGQRDGRPRPGDVDVERQRELGGRDHRTGSGDRERRAVERRRERRASQRLRLRGDRGGAVDAQHERGQLERLDLALRLELCRRQSLGEVRSRVRRRAARAQQYGAGADDGDRRGQLRVRAMRPVWQRLGGGPARVRSARATDLHPDAAGRADYGPWKRSAESRSRRSASARPTGVRGKPRRATWCARAAATICLDLGAGALNLLRAERGPGGARPGGDQPPAPRSFHRPAGAAGLHGLGAGRRASPADRRAPGPAVDVGRLRRGRA